MAQDYHRFSRRRFDHRSTIPLHWKNVSLDRPSAVLGGQKATSFAGAGVDAYVDHRKEREARVNVDVDILI